MPNTIAALTFVHKGRLEWRDVPRPQLHGPDEALVRPIAASRCDGDCLFLFHDYSRALQLGAALHVIDPEVRELGDRPFAGPFAYGHECIAEVIDVGDAVRAVTVGQRVVVPWAISCGGCGACRRGLTSQCERRGSTLAAYGFGGRSGGWGGMVSDVLRVPFADGMLVPVPAGASPLTLAGASDNLPDAWRTVAPHLRAEPGAPVLVVGGAARSIGLYAAGIAVALGSSRVDYVDDDLANLTIAERLGANPIALRRRPWWRRGGLPLLPMRYPIAVDASNREAGLDLAIRALAPGGVCTAVGFYFRCGTPLPLWHMYLKGARLHVGIANPRADLPGLLDLIAGGRFDPARVTARTSRWDEAADAFLDRGPAKVLVTRPPAFGPPGCSAAGAVAL
ncbi:MAG TPA: alcohol dehydrogenase catalytic domain-containing protein [Vicinamibacterales bacterium]|nr:alcohol dehydrogenase catalytic domain-containing protein [Vicinamibacterales bacterium]